MIKNIKINNIYIVLLFELFIRHKINNGVDNSANMNWINGSSMNVQTVG